MAVARKTQNENEIRYDTDPWTKKFTLVKIKTATTVGMNGEPFSYPLLTVLEDGVEKLLHGYPASLLAELKRVQPAPGDEFTVEYQGEKQTKAGYTAKIFEVDSPNAAAFDWDQPGF